MKFYSLHVMERERSFLWSLYLKCPFHTYLFPKLSRYIIICGIIYMLLVAFDVKEIIS